MNSSRMVYIAGDGRGGHGGGGGGDKREVRRTAKEGPGTWDLGPKT